MLKLYAKKITNFLVVNSENVNDEDSKYLLKDKIFYLITRLVVVLIIGLILNKLLHSIIFLISYGLIKELAGICFTDNRKKSNLIFFTVFLLSIFIIKYIDYGQMDYIILSITFSSWINIILNLKSEYIKISFDKFNINGLIKIFKMIILTLILLFTILGLSLNSIYEYSIYSVAALFWVNLMMIRQIIINIS